MNLTMDLSGLPLGIREAVVAKLQREDLAQQAVAWAEQARMAEFYRQAQVGTTRDGVGPMSAVMHVGLKNLLAAHYGHQTVYQDPDFMKFALKKHECFRVNEHGGTRVQVGWRRGSVKRDGVKREG